jgi:AcrR family transcriptional regulator
MMKNGAPPSRKRRLLTIDRIAVAALAILDAAGPAALTARALASRLGCEPMSLYHHVANMDAVQDLVVDHLLAQLHPAIPPSGNALEIMAHAQRFIALAKEHPHPFALIATRRWRLPRGQALANYLVQCFALTTPHLPDALTKARIVGAYMNGAGLALAAWQLSSPIQYGDADVLGPLRDSFTADQVKLDLLAGLELLIGSLVSAGSAT